MTDTLLIVEDDPEIASALVRGLALHGYRAQSENRAHRALDTLRGGGISGAIVDVMLGTDSGIDLVRDARAAGVQIPILMLSALSDVEHRSEGLEAGADDYVVKPFSFDELVARLRVQERRAVARTPDPALLNQVARTLTIQDTSIALTDREFELLMHLIEHGQTPQPRGDIFDALWAADGSASENVVDVYIGYLRKKLAQADFGFEIKTVRNKGFCLSGLPPAQV